MTNRSLDTNWKIGNYYKNRHREVDDYIEVEIYGQREYHIGQIDKEFLDKFKERTWTAFKDGNYFYMCSGKTMNFPFVQKFHQLVLPDVDQVDHIYRNTLDNRKKNLRDGSGKVNNNNQALRDDNTSGTTGVSFYKQKKSWRVTWQENRKQQYKSFSIKRYGGYEEAKQEAIEYRKTKNKITGCMNGY